jgi:hypothetical protein
VEQDLDPLFAQVIADIVVERFGAKSYLKETVQTKL